MVHTIKRSYDHKKYGHIGAITLVVDGDTWTLNDKVLPADGILHLLTHASQSPQDAYAGADNLEDAQAAFDKKVTRIIDGSIGIRGTGVDSFTKECRSIARTLFKGQLGKEDAKIFTAKDAKDQTAILDKIIDKNRKIIEAAAKKVMAEKEAVKSIKIDVKI